VRRSFEVLGARLRVTAWWNGAAADRLLDERHAGLGERAIRFLRACHWLTLPEVTFSEFGERGSIDILGGHEPTRSVLVGEVKGSIGSIEETNRRLDVKERLAWKLGRERFGWKPATVSRVLILPEDSTVRRVVLRHAETMAAAYPARSREFRTWVRHPAGRIAALWFLSEVAGSDRDSTADVGDSSAERARSQPPTVDGITPPETGIRLLSATDDGKRPAYFADLTQDD